MTIRPPQKNLLDKFLALFGKERDIVVPEGVDEIYDKYGPYANVKVKRENFIKALFKKK